MNSVIVDDQSLQITYTGAWTGGGSSNNYDHTTTASRAAGATMIFPFSGTSVSVIGSYDADTSCTGTFSIDENVTQFASPVAPTALNHQSIWSSAPLPDGSHTLTYRVTSCTSSGNSTPGYVWFDYILYTPSPSASKNGLVYFVDDSDSSITYSGNWTVETKKDTDFALTSHGGKQGCSFQLDFEGTLASVFGRIGNDSDNAATQMSFSVDGASPVVFSSPYQTTISYNQALFQSTNLAQGKHSLVATSNSGTVFVDYILLQPNPTSNTTIPVADEHSLPIGEIAGGAAGALVLAVIIAVVVIFRRRLFKGRLPAARPPMLSRPPNFAVFNAREAVPPSTISSQSLMTYPPASSSVSFLSTDPLNPFATPLASPLASSFSQSTSSDDSRSALSTTTPLIANASPPTPWSTSYASSSGHSRRIPSIGGDGDSVADLKRRQQLAPPHDDTLSVHSASDAASRTSSVRPLPVVPSPGSRPPASGSRYAGDEPPPVYTLE
ncbi:hypothetical protein B0H16DRAFT_889009 [Mycena metata]|uniref:Transmembrane protein n=1 Tax=Mycena metata TaxID=1033252 RepID=A0AAD7K723_9AGAR|nr:hypothetical protein B0H16DRAFT_889009 [Mycena metata]